MGKNEGKNEGKIGRKKILVTGAGGDSGLATIRILRKTTNHKIFGCDASEYASGLHLAHKSFVVPKAVEKGFIDSIKEKVKEEGIDIVLPNVDEELEIFAGCREEIPQAVISPLETVRICDDKLKTISKLKGIVPVPVVYDNVQGIREEAFPVLLKPRVGRGSRNVFEINNQKELLAIREYLDSVGVKRDQQIIQEYLPGEEYTIDALFDFNGKMVVAVPRKRIVTKGGISAIGKTEKNEKVIEFIEKISKNLVFHGPINIQFKEDKSGELKLLEINPRFSGGLPITYQSGINIPKLVLELAENKEIQENDLNWDEVLVFRHLTEVGG